MSKSTDIVIFDVRSEYETHDFRTPLKFGGAVQTFTTLLNVKIRVRTRDGREAEGSGSVPLGNIWSFPSQTVSADRTLEAMKTLQNRIVSIVRDCGLEGHPIEIATHLESAFLAAADEVSREMNLAEPIPKLCTLVTASPFDAALHDGYGKALGLNSYNTLSAEFMNRDLSHYLTEEFKGEFLDRYTSRQPKATMPLYHLVGALDPITDADIASRINDGLPETVPEWIMANGLTHLKIKLNGDNADWDIDRIARVHAATAETQIKRGCETWVYSLDFNEKCRNVEYLIEVLERTKENAPGAFERVAYIEQPTARDLKAHPENKMHKAAAIKPVVIDESLTDFEALQLSMEQGYSGVALKACKGQSQALLMGAAAQKYQLFLCVQDLTTPGESFLHSAGLAARVPTITAIEGNGRQYCPRANTGWEDRFPSIFHITDGTVGTGCLTANGLGH